MSRLANNPTLRIADLLKRKVDRETTMIPGNLKKAIRNRRKRGFEFHPATQTVKYLD